MHTHMHRIHAHESAYGEMPFRDQEEESKRQFLQIISSSSIQDPDLIPLSCKTLSNQGTLVRDQKSLESDLVRDHHHHHAENLLTHSSIHFIHNPSDPMADVLLESVRMDSITGRTMTTDSNMTSISDSMSPFVEVNGSAVDLLHEDAAGILILPVSSTATATPSELLIPRTSYQTTYQTSPAGTIGFNRHSDVRFMKSLMPTRPASNISFTQDPHQLHRGMQVHQQLHHQPDNHQYKKEEEAKEQEEQEYKRDDGLDVGPSQSTLSRRCGRDTHLWHHPPVSTLPSLMSQPEKSLSPLSFFLLIDSAAAAALVSRPQRNRHLVTQYPRDESRDRLLFKRSVDQREVMRDVRMAAGY